MTEEVIQNEEKPKGKKTKDLAKIEHEASPMQLLAMATKMGADVEKMSKLLDLQERWEANQAKKAFNEAMAGFQGECPVIKKGTAGGQTKAGKIAYRYATLGAIVDQTRHLLEKHGLSYAIKTEFPDGQVKAICIVKHAAGHTEQSEVVMPLATRTEIMSAPQQVAATITFAKRYAFVNAFGIMTDADDVDASKIVVEPLDISQYETKLRGAKNEEELKKIWASLPPMAKGQLNVLKEELKAKFLD